MKIQVQITIQSDEDQAEVVHEVARLERGPLRPDTLGLSLAEARKRLCGPLAHSCFHHRPDLAHRPESKLEAAYHKADRAIQDIVELLAAA